MVKDERVFFSLNFRFLTLKSSTSNQMEITIPISMSSWQQGHLKERELSFKSPMSVATKLF